MTSPSARRRRASGSSTMATALPLSRGDVAGLAQREVAPAQQGQAHGLEVAGGDDVVLGVDRVVLGGAGQAHVRRPPRSS